MLDDFNKLHAIRENSSIKNLVEGFTEAMSGFGNGLIGSCRVLRSIRSIGDAAACSVPSSDHVLHLYTVVRLIVGVWRFSPQVGAAQNACSTFRQHTQRTNIT